jgi:hypothetical protein
VKNHESMNLRAVILSEAKDLAAARTQPKFT